MNASFRTMSQVEGGGELGRLIHRMAGGAVLKTAPLLPGSLAQFHKLRHRARAAQCAGTDRRRTQAAA